MKLPLELTVTLPEVGWVHVVTVRSEPVSLVRTLPVAVPEPGEREKLSATAKGGCEDGVIGGWVGGATMGGGRIMTGGGGGGGGAMIVGGG